MKHTILKKYFLKKIPFTELLIASGRTLERIEESRLEIERLNRGIVTYKEILNRRYVEFKKLLNPGDIAIDAGANVGNITEMFNTMGCFVHAFEPNKEAFTVLSEKFKNIESVKCINSAVSTVDGERKLYLHSNADQDAVKWSTGSSLLGDKPNVNKNNFNVVQTMNLSGYIRSMGKQIRVLKMDIEGEEISVLNHLIDERTVHLIDYIFVETHDDKIATLVEATQLLREKIRLQKLHHISLDWI